MQLQCEPTVGDLVITRERIKVHDYYHVTQKHWCYRNPSPVDPNQREEFKCFEGNTYVKVGRSWSFVEPYQVDMPVYEVIFRYRSDVPDSPKAQGEEDDDDLPDLIYPDQEEDDDDDLPDLIYPDQEEMQTDRLDSVD